VLQNRITVVYFNIPNRFGKQVTGQGAHTKGVLHQNGKTVNLFTHVGIAKRQKGFGMGGQTSKLDQGDAHGAFFYPPLPVIKPAAIQVVLPTKFNLGKSAGLLPGKHLFPV
jgi:hypothetical protein